MAPATGEGEGEGPEAAALPARMRSHLTLLRAESAILDRLVYKGKNQHRRCHYFKSLLKVRRDVHLLLSAGVEEILTELFQVVDGTNPERRFHALHRLKKEHVGGKHNFHYRLLGVARLLSQMTEPLLQAAVQISALFARAFFMSYSLIILSLLARMRVLLQQMLLDSVTVFNQVTSLCQKKHAITLIHEGIKAYREYYPPCREFLMLKCVWEGDKFVLHEEIDNSSMKTVYIDDKEPSILEMPALVYDVLDVPRAGSEHIIMERSHDDTAIERLRDQVSLEDKVNGNLKAQETISIGNDDNKIEDGCPSPPDSLPEVLLVASICSSNDIKPCSENASGGKVAFIPVNKATGSRTDEGRRKKRARKQPHTDNDISGESDDPFFRLLTAGSKGIFL